MLGGPLDPDNYDASTMDLDGLMLILFYESWLAFLSSLRFLSASLTFSIEISPLQRGHLCTSSSIFALNQPSMQLVWKRCLHVGSFLTLTPFSKCSKHITHSFYLNSSMRLSKVFSLMRLIRVVSLSFCCCSSPTLCCTCLSCCCSRALI